jgi:hypothetical protein
MERDMVMAAIASEMVRGVAVTFWNSEMLDSENGRGDSESGQTTDCLGKSVTQLPN